MGKVKLRLVLLAIIFTNFMYAQEGMTPREKKLIIEKYNKNSNNHQFTKLELDVIYNYLKNQDTKKIDEACSKFNKRVPTKEEIRRKKKKKKEKSSSQRNSVINTTPINLPSDARFPGEFEEIQGVFVSYPYSFTLVSNSYVEILDISEYSDGSPSYAKFFRELIDGIQQAGVKAYISIRSQTDIEILTRHFREKGTPLTNYEFLINPTDSFWTRDSGPINFYYGTDDKIGWVDLNYYDGRDDDDNLTPLWAQRFNLPYSYMPIEYEGGNMLMNGQQTLTTSDRVYDANSTYTKSQIDQMLKNSFNLDHLHVLKSLIYDGGTGHVDLYIDMLNENRFVYTKQPTEMANIPDYPDYQAVLDNIDYLSTQPSPGGANKPYTFGTVPFPTRDDGSVYDDRYEINSTNRTYSNHLIVNKTIIQPVFNNGQTGNIAGDNANLEKIRQEYPGYRIIQIDGRILEGSGGSVHCVTKEFHAENPVRFKHYSYTGEIDNCESSYPVDVVITNKSGINNATLFSRAKGSSSWNQTSMTKSENNHWSANITLTSGNSQVTEYYISATSNNNKTMTYPMTGAQGGAFTFWCTSQTDTEAPTAPTNLTASNITQTTVDLSWTSSTDNIEVTGYEIYQGSTLLGTTASITSFPVSNLTANTSYTFYVKAKDAAGNISVSSNEINVTTLTDNTNPNDCSNIPDYQEGATYSNGDRVVYENKVYERINNQWVHQFDCDVAPSDTQAPSVPSNLTASNVTQTSADLTWNASTDNVAVTGYEVYQGNTFIGSTSSITSFSVNNLIENTTYSFTVYAKDEAGNISSASNTVTIKTQAVITTPNDCSNIPAYQSGQTYFEGDQVVYNNKVYKVINGNFTHQFDCDSTPLDTEVPTAPSNLNAYDITETTLELSWNASTDNIAVLEYDIYQDDLTVGRTPEGITTFHVSNLTENTSYTFTVYAKDEAGNISGASNTITVKTQAVITAPNDCSNIAAYQSGQAYFEGDQVVYNNKVYKVINGNFTYQFDCGSTPADTQAPTAPNNLNAYDVTETTLELSWDASTDNIAVTEYDIYQGNSIVGRTPAGIRNFHVANLIESSSYSFVVYAKDEAGNISSASNVVNITTAAAATDPNDCSNIPAYQEGATYSHGDRIVYQNQVYEMSYGQWVYLFDCTASSRGTAAFETTSKVTIYPNPAESYFSIASDKPIEGTTYAIFDTNGKMLKSGKYQSYIDIQELNLISGTTYYVKFYTNNQVVEKKLIKK
ncbi:Por secretion system C-terminal sorting domain-containing protein [Tenacibaculum sp. MAR_2009_124]|uniref:fibronectin type III domain-containing protein n=1 Tax=Tenacibaculum sp. MAR_2009_124 TaxID=1250059 RepID=UPI00089649D3|nr:fibronectin type III domain-containing protein [Tenacibaculum sp. MAR_2009_124]SEC87036.1 Por secretion system C-terminal sorting domain-containing protein [Tenacibaculum sp. MAR_2009_124]